MTVGGWIAARCASMYTVYIYTEQESDMPKSMYGSYKKKKKSKKSTTKSTTKSKKGGKRGYKKK
jgi:hypothetical protein